MPQAAVWSETTEKQWEEYDKKTLKNKNITNPS